jgi:chaperonin cofactor prefoldin
VPTPQDRIIDQLESDIEHLKMEIFELKGVNKLLKKQLKEATEELQKNQGYYDDDGNYVE